MGKRSPGSVANRRGEEFKKSITDILEDKGYQFIKKINFFST